MTGMTPEGFEIDRDFAAPPSAVFAAWTTAEQFARWFGGKDVQIPASHAALAAGFSAAFGVAAGIFAASAMIGALILPRQVSTPNSGESTQGNGEADQPAPGGTDGRDPARNYAGGV
jgi:hypothetical protein